MPKNEGFAGFENEYENETDSLNDLSLRDMEDLSDKIFLSKEEQYLAEREYQRLMDAFQIVIDNIRYFDLDQRTMMQKAIYSANVQEIRRNRKRNEG